MSVCKGGTRLDSGGPGGPAICPSGRDEVHRSQVSLIFTSVRKRNGNRAGSGRWRCSNLSVSQSDGAQIICSCGPSREEGYLQAADQLRLICVHLREQLTRCPWKYKHADAEKAHPYQYVWRPSLSNDLVVIWSPHPHDGAC